jgi:aminoglycoside phosphotransferase family enzyme
MKAKYVMTAIGPVIFPDSIKHEAFKYLKPVSAGFVMFDDKGKATTYGRSKSLDLDSRPEDAIFIEICFEVER